MVGGDHVEQALGVMVEPAVVDQGVDGIAVLVGAESLTTHGARDSVDHELTHHVAGVGDPVGY